MDTLSLYFINLGAVTIMMMAGWLVSLKTDNVTHVDSLWGMGFVLIAWLSLASGESSTPRGWLLAVLTTAWGCA